MSSLIGLSWGHRRATAPLQALSEAFAADEGIEVTWLDRTLADFEHQGIAAAAQDVDFIVFDHPFCGDIAASGALMPLDGMADDLLGPTSVPRFVSASLDSYRYGGAIYGAPIDGATMHAIVRRDLLGDRAVPTTWDEAVALARDARREGQYVALPLKTPHAGLALASLLENMAPGWGPGRSEHGAFVDRPELEDGLDLLRVLVETGPPDAATWNAIDLHDAMQERNDIIYCPCAYGYATYGEALGSKPRLSFAPFAGVGGSTGAILGGTGLGLTVRGAGRQGSEQFIRYCLDVDRQVSLIGGNHGQPAVRQAWVDTDLDATFGGYYSSVIGTMETSSVRPRWVGYPAFQQAFGLEVQRFLTADQSLVKAAANIRALEREAQARRGGSGNG